MNILIYITIFHDWEGSYCTKPIVSFNTGDGDDHDEDEYKIYHTHYAVNSKNIQIRLGNIIPVRERIRGIVAHLRSLHHGTDNIWSGDYSAY